MSKPRLLDLFCGAGGAAMGYSRAGFEVVGVDIKPQPHYPFEFHQADALTYPLEGFDTYHASPPCQGYSIMRNLPWLKDKEYPMLIPAVREMLLATHKPYVIENVGGARHRSELPEGLKGAWLCGAMFGFPFYRHRYFETSMFWLQPAHPNHCKVIKPGRMFGERQRKVVYSDAEDSRGIKSWPGRRGQAGNGLTLKDEITAAEAMGIDWMTSQELTQAIPPAYTEYIGKYLMQAVMS